MSLKPLGQSVHSVHRSPGGVLLDFSDEQTIPFPSALMLGAEVDDTFGIHNANTQKLAQPFTLNCNKIVPITEKSNSANMKDFLGSPFTNSELVVSVSPFISANSNLAFEKVALNYEDLSKNKINPNAEIKNEDENGNPLDDPSMKGPYGDDIFDIDNISTISVSDTEFGDEDGVFADIKQLYADKISYILELTNIGENEVTFNKKSEHNQSGNSSPEFGVKSSANTTFIKSQREKNNKSEKEEAPNVKTNVRKNHLAELEKIFAMAAIWTGVDLDDGSETKVIELGHIETEEIPNIVTPHDNMDVSHMTATSSELGDEQGEVVPLKLRNWNYNNRQDSVKKVEESQAPTRVCASAPVYRKFIPPMAASSPKPARDLNRTSMDSSVLAKPQDSFSRKSSNIKSSGYGQPNSKMPPSSPKFAPSPLRARKSLSIRSPMRLPVPVTKTAGNNTLKPKQAGSKVDMDSTFTKNSGNSTSASSSRSTSANSIQHPKPSMHLSTQAKTSSLPTTRTNTSINKIKTETSTTTAASKKGAGDISKLLNKFGFRK